VNVLAQAMHEKYTKLLTNYRNSLATSTLMVWMCWLILV